MIRLFCVFFLNIISAVAATTSLCVATLVLSLFECIFRQYMIHASDNLDCCGNAHFCHSIPDKLKEEREKKTMS